MFNSDRILALDIGASKLVLAEFSVQNARVPELLRYGIQELGSASTGETDASAFIVSAVRDLMREHHIRRAPMLMTLSGQAVFPRYVKLPPVTGDKLEQIVRYEAEQNVPFPIDQVVWDYQLIGDASEGEQNVMLVAVKTENVRELTDCVVAADLEPEIVDVAPMALYNTVRFNYPDLEGCTMILDIGARSTNLIFLEEERIFSRSIPVAGNTITQELAKDFQVSFEDAEKLKKEHAFVALGGVTAVEDETADRVSKIVRNVVTRLHAEASRSINFYRGQQGGTAPQRVLLTGGTSVIPYMDTFFREKLKVDVEFLNPFVNVAVSEQIDTAAAAEKLYLLGEVVGLALRRSWSCPVEINLMPPELVQKKTFRRRIPYFGVSAAALVLTLLGWGVHVKVEDRILAKQKNQVENGISELDRQNKQLRQIISDRQAVEQEVGRIGGLIASRTLWSEMLKALNDCLLDGMWIRAISPVNAPDNTLKQIRITAYGFRDKLDAVKTSSADETWSTIFVDRLRATSLFSQETRVVEVGMTDDRSQRFITVVAGLERKRTVKVNQEEGENDE